MRAAGRSEGLRLSIVVDARSAERVAHVVRELSPAANLTVISVDPDGISTALRIREAVSRGELVGILADRSTSKDERNVEVEFLGGRAPFPTGPYLVAHALGCPVYQVFGLFTAPNRYDLFCEPFAERVRIGRDEHGSREPALEAYAQRYADNLARQARRAPYNWFNFYPFWKE